MAAPDDRNDEGASDSQRDRRKETKKETDFARVCRIETMKETPLVALCRWSITALIS
jgi:hypothetical protein